MKTPPKYTYFAKIDAGEKYRTSKAQQGDCTVRALATATGITYPLAWDLLYKHQGERKSNCFNLGAFLDERYANLATLTLANDYNPTVPHWLVKSTISFPGVKGKPRMTPAAFVKAYPKGNFILNMAGHVVAVRDGLVIDRWDCTARCVYNAWEILPTPVAAAAISTPAPTAMPDPANFAHPSDYGHALRRYEESISEE